MENSQPSPSNPPQRKTNFQSIEEFMKEQDELDAIRLATGKSSARLTPLSARPSKKARKVIDIEELAREAKALDEIGDLNWIGRLQEYRAVNPPTDGLKYIDTVVGEAPSRFSCAAVVAESSRPFGDTVSFTKKKDAKQYASKEAIDWLIKNNFMPAVGVKFPKPKSVNQTVSNIKVASPRSTNTPIITVKEVTSQSPAATTKSTSFAGRIPDLCTRLGFTVPKYEITRVSEDVALYSGYAHFNDPRIEGKVGEVKGVFGQKNAKEMIAEELYAFLKDIEKQRLAVVESRKAGEGTAPAVKVQA